MLKGQPTWKLSNLHHQMENWNSKAYDSDPSHPNKKNTAIRGRIFHIWTFNSSIMNIKQRLNRVKEWTIYNLIKAKNICFSAINHRKKCCDTRFIKKLFKQKPSPAFRLLPSPLKTNLSTIITGNNPWGPPAHFNINPQNISSSMTFRASSQTGLLSQAFDYLSI